MPFFPIHDGRTLSHIALPVASWAIIAANIFVYVFIQGAGFGEGSQGTVLSYGLIPAVYNDYAALPPGLAVLPDNLTLLSYAFLHGDFWHLLGNMIFLWVFADNVEDAFGHIRFVLFYVLCAIAAGYAYILTDPTSQAPVIGASGAVAGVVAAYLMLHPRQKVWILALGRIPLRLGAMWVLGFWILFQVYSVLVAAPDETVAWWSHIGGLAAGAAMTPFLRRRGVALFDRETALPAPPPFGSVDRREPRR